MNSSIDALVLTFDGDPETCLRSIEGNLLERGISFRTVNVDAEKVGDIGALLDKAGKTIFIAEELLRRVAADPAWQEPLAEFAKRRGFLSPYGNKPEAIGKGWLRSVVDSMLAAVVVEEAVAYSGLQTGNAEFLRERSGRDAGPLFAAEYRELEKWLEQPRNPSEWHMHRGKAAEALILSGDHNIAGRYLVTTKKYFGEKWDYFYDDQFSALMAPAILGRAGVDDSLVPLAHRQLRNALERRPRIGKFRSYVGYADEPLKALARLDSEGQTSGVNLGLGGHDCVSNEMLHFTAAALVTVGVACGDAELADDGVELCDHVYRVHRMANGLLHHVSQGEEARGAAWGRGQTHAIYGLVYCLDVLSEGTEAQGKLRGYLVDHLRAILPYQDEATGLWRNVIDRPDARLESSCTVGIVIALAKALSRGWIERAVAEPAIDRAWKGLRAMMHAGALGAFCRGTYAGGSTAHYIARPQGWGPAPQMILMGVELYKLGKIKSLPGAVAA